MAADSTHPDYSAAAEAWSRARDVLAGEDAVKAAGDEYLPRLDSQGSDEYEAYKARASFFGATRRTLEEYLDLIFRRAPTLSLVDGGNLRAFVGDCDLWGMDFLRYARLATAEVLSVGRAGSLVLQDGESGKPWASLWRAEEVIDWELKRGTLVRVVLRRGDKLRVFRLVDGACFEELWLRSEGEGGWTLGARAAVKRGEAPLPFVPFVFHGPRHSRPEPDRLPLADIIAANLDHYRLDADYKHGLHFVALPTAWVAGFEKPTLKIGSSTAWCADASDAKAGFLEFSGAGLAHLERALEKVERRMALLGARMLEGTSVPGAGGGGDTAHARLCGLGSIVASLNESLSQVLRIAQWWIDGGDVRAQTASIAMDTDLSARAVSGDLITAVVGAWRNGGISRETMLDWLKRWEVLPDGRSVAQERALIHGKAGGEA